MSTADQLVKVLGQMADQALAKKALEELSVFRARALQIQDSAMAIANLPTAEHLAKLERRLRSTKDGLSDLTRRVGDLDSRATDLKAVVMEMRSELGSLRAELAEIKARPRDD